MRLSIEKRLKIVKIYNENQLHLVKGRFFVLKALAEQEKIFVSIFSLRKLIRKWIRTSKII